MLPQTVKNGDVNNNAAISLSVFLAVLASVFCLANLHQTLQNRHLRTSPRMGFWADCFWQFILRLACGMVKI